MSKYTYVFGYKIGDPNGYSPPKGSHKIRAMSEKEARIRLSRWLHNKFPEEQLQFECCWVEKSTDPQLEK